MHEGIRSRGRCPRGLLVALLCAVAGAGAGIAQADSLPAITGPQALSPGERAIYRVRVAGDPAADTCAAGLRVELPEGFRLLRSHPAASAIDPRGRFIEFAPLERLRRGEESIHEVELEAPRAARVGALCARLSYGICPQPRTADLVIGPACTTLVVVEPTATASQPPLRARQQQSLRVIPCGSRPTVTPGPGVFDAAEWSDAASQVLPTTPPTTVYAKTSGSDLFVAFRTSDGSAIASDAVQLFVDVDADSGAPDGADRSYLVPRMGGGSRFSGTAGFSTLLGPFSQYELAELGSEWIVELQIALADLGGPTDPSQDIRLAVGVADGGVSASWPASFVRTDQSTMSDSELTYCVAGTCTFTTWAQAPDALDPLTATNLELMYDDLDGPNSSYARAVFDDGSWTRSTAFSNGGSTGNILQVEGLLRFYVDAPVGNDALDLEVYYNGVRIAQTTISNGQLNTYLNNPSTYVWDLSFARPWLMSDFALSNDLDFRVLPSKNGSWDQVGLLVDAVGLRVRTDGSCRPPSAAGGIDTFVNKDDGYATVLAGQYLTYQLQFGNQGVGSATEVEIVDRIPANTTYHRGGTGLLCPPEAICETLYSATGVAWTPTEPADGASPMWLKFRISLLVPAGSVTYTAAYQVRVDPFATAGTKVENDATLSQRQADADPADNSDWDDGPTAGDNLGDEVGPFVFPSITIPCDFTIPVIDGVIDVNAEYPRAKQMTRIRSGGSESVTIYVQHDTTHIYVAFDVDDDQNNNRDGCYVVIDTNNNKIDPDAPDRQYERERGPQNQVLAGIGSNSDRRFWQNFLGSSAASDRSERAGGWQAEFQIPLADFPSLSGQGEVIGIAFLNFSTSCGSCWASEPSFAQLDNASSWTNAYLDLCSPDPDFECVSACADQDIVCTDKSTLAPASWEWDFGDGSPVDTNQNPVHRFPAGGTYNVSLKVCNANGCSTQTLPVDVWGLPQPSLVAAASVCLTPTGSVPLDASGSLPGAGAVIANPGGYSYATTLGTVSGGQSALETLDGSLATAGLATVTLTVTDSRSCTATVTRDVVLAAPPLPGIVPSPPALCGYPPANTTVQLDGSGTGFPSGSTPTLWSWTVATGGTVGSGSSVDWDVPGGTPPGLYSADLSVTDSYSCIGATSASLRLWRPPSVRASAQPQRRCTDPAAVMTFALGAVLAAGDGVVPAAGYTWTTTAGTLSGGSSANETLDLPPGFTGTVDVCVRATDEYTCFDQSCTQVIVDPLPVPDFTAALPTDCADPLNPIVIPLDAATTTPFASIPDPAGFNWSTTLGSSVLSQTQGPRPTLTLPPGWSGTLSVTLDVSDGNGCAASTTRDITIKPGPTPAFAPATFERCTDITQDNVIDLDASTSGSPAGIDPSGFIWSLNPPVGSLSSTTGPVTRLTLPSGYAGTVTVTLSLTDRDGCTRTLAADYTLLAPPVVNLVADRLSSCRAALSPQPFQLDASASSSAAGIDDPTGFSWWASAGTLSRSDGPSVALTPQPNWFGAIDVRVTVTDRKGCVSERTLTLVVSPGPVVAASVTPDRLCAPAGDPSEFLLDAAGSSAQEGIAEILWTTSEPLATLLPTGLGVASLSLPAGFAGVVPLDVRVTDNVGCVAVESLTATVDPKPVADFSVPASACDRDGLGARFALDAGASLLPSGPAGTSPYVWTASAGTITPGASPELATLTAPAGYLGPITITLSVFDARGCEDMTAHTVRVESGPRAVLQSSVAALCSPDLDLDVDLDASGSGLSDPAAYSWSVTPASLSLGSSNGVTNTVRIPAGFSGTVDVSVTVTDALGCTSSQTRSIEVWPTPVPRIDAVAAVCAPAGDIQIPLDASASTPASGIPDPAGYRWSASAGVVQPATGRSVTLLLPASFPGGVVDVTLELEDVNGCRVSLVQSLNVSRGPVASLKTADRSACQDPAGTGFDLDASGSTGSGLGFAWTSSVSGTTFTSPAAAVSRALLPGSFAGDATITVEVTDSAGCRASADLLLHVNAVPAGNLAAAVSPSCATPSVALDASSFAAVEPGATLVGWSFTATGGPIQVPLASDRIRLDYPVGTSGNFNASVTVTDSNGCATGAGASFALAPPPAPTPELTVSLAGACAAGGPVVALDASASSATPPASLSAWQFTATGPATVTASGATATLSYPPGTTGSFSATVAIDDSLSCSASLTRAFTIVRGQAPVARLSAAVLDVCLAPGAGTDIALDASSSDPGSFLWWSSPGTSIVGTGSRVLLRLPAGTSGLVQARITVTAPNGCASDAVVEILAREMPVALASATPVAACEGPSGTSFTLSSAGSLSHHPLDSSLSYLWTASEGALMSPSGASSSLLVPRTGAGRSLTSTLVVMDAGGCASAPAALTMAIEASPRADFSVTPAPPGQGSQFSSAPASGGTPPYSYLWSFGDGGSSVSPAPTHVYAAAGSYVVKLAIVDQKGCRDERSQTLVIGEGAMSGSLRAEGACAGLESTLRATVTGGTPPLSFDWLFGDGQSSNGSAATVTHRYATAGSFPVTVTVRDQGGLSLTLTTTVAVAAAPVVTATTSGPGLAGVAQSFEASAGSEPASFQWSFSDGATATGSSVTHTWTAPGNVTATVIATTAEGCTGSDTVSLGLATGDTEVAFAKSVSPGETGPGGEVVYELYIGNGQALLRNLEIEDDLPAGFDYRPGTLSINGAGVSEPLSQSPLRIAIPSLGPGGVLRIRYGARVAASVPAGSHDNSATLRATDSSGRVYYAGPRVATVRVSGEPVVETPSVDLRLIKRADADPEPAAPGGLVHYRIEYRNAGEGTATGVVLHDDWPYDRAVLIENGDGGVVLGSRIEWQLGSLPAGAGGTIQYSIRLNADLADGTAIRNVVLASSLEPDLHPQDNRDAVDLAIGGLPDLSLRKAVATSPDPALPGATATYTLSWANAGAPAPAAVVIDDYDESKLEIVSLPAGATEAGGVIRFELGNIAAAQTGTLSYQATLREGTTGAVVNVARIESDLADVNGEDNQAEARFDVVLREAELVLSGELAPTRRCHQPQVEMALRGGEFDTQGAMAAAAAFVATAARLEASGAASDPLLASASLPALRERLLAFARLNVESLLLDSGMGLEWAPTGRSARVAELAQRAGLGAAPVLPAPVSIPYESAHPVFALQRGLDEPWCRHETHRATTPAAIGSTLVALAALAERGLDSGDPGERFRSRVLLDQAAEAVAWLEQGRRQGIAGSVPGPLPERILLLSDAQGRPQPSIESSASSAFQQARLAHGLFALAALGARAGSAVPAGLAEAALRLGDTVLEDLAAHLSGEPPLLADGNRVRAVDVAAAASALEAARAAGSGGIPPVLEPALLHSLTALEGSDASGFAQSLDRDSGSRGAVTLASESAGLEAALLLGERVRAASAWRRLETSFVESRLHVYRSSQGGGAIHYTPALLASVIGGLGRLLEGASPFERASLFERIDATIEKIAIEAGLQTGLVSRSQDAGGLRLILGADGEVKVSAVVADSPHVLAPVLVDAVSFLPQGVHHRDRSLVDAARGISEEGSAVAYLSGQTGDCRTAEVRLEDRRFRTETGLLTVAAMAEAGAALRAVGARSHDALLSGFGVELEGAATGNATTLGMFSGMGLRLRFAAGLGSAETESRLLDGYARSAGLAAAPTSILPIWLAFDGGDPVFTAPLDARAGYAQGWEPSRFIASVTPQALGQALAADVRVAARGLTSDSPWQRFVGLVRLHAAGLQVKFIANEVESGGSVPELAPVLDAEGRTIDLGRAPGKGSLAGDAAVLDALGAYLALARDGALDALPASARPPIETAAAERAFGLLLARVRSALAKGPGGDPLALLYALRALDRSPVAASEPPTERRALAQVAADGLAASSATAAVSPLALAAFRLEALSRTSGDPERVTTAYRGLRDAHFDRTWRLFRSGVEAASDRRGATGDGFLLTDLDVGSVLAALTRALPLLGRSDAEEAADLIYAAGGRMLFETGLEREHRVQEVVEGVNVPGRALQISRAVSITIADSPVPAGTVYPGDLVTGRFTVSNPADSSVADDSVLRLVAGERFRYVPGSSRIDGKQAPDPAAGSSLDFPLGRLGGTQSAEVSLLLTVVADAPPGAYKLPARASAKSRPGPDGKPLETPPVVGALAVDGFGGAAGRIFIDADEDGVAGPGDPGVADVTVVLDDGTATVTDSEGRYRFSSLVPGAYRLRVLETSLPGPMSTVGTGESKIRVRPHEVAHGDFVVRAAQTVTGVVYRDENGNRRMDSGEDVVAGAVVETDSGQRSISDRAGRYLIRGVAGGSHVVRLARRQPWVKDPIGLLLRPMALPQATLSQHRPR